MKYIDAEKLIAEIAVLKKGVINKWLENPRSSIDDGFLTACSRFLEIIASLQQEQPEVDLDEEVHRFFEECIEVHEVPLYGKVKEGVISVDCYELTARHFAEWGAIHLTQERRKTNESTR